MKEEEKGDLWFDLLIIVILITPRLGRTLIYPLFVLIRAKKVLLTSKGIKIDFSIALCVIMIARYSLKMTGPASFSAKINISIFDINRLIDHIGGRHPQHAL